MISDKEGLLWLYAKLNMGDNSFRNSTTYRMLKQELSIKGYWRAKQRGNPRKGFQAMKERLTNE